MKLYLSSYRVGNDPEALRRLAGGGTRAAIVMNAADGFEDRLYVWPREETAMAELGFDVTELDLRDYFTDHDGLRERLRGIDLLWVAGGNTFVLGRAMREAGFAEIAEEVLRTGTLTYGGYSAGACVVTPGFEGIEMMDDPAVIPQGYPPGGRPAALGWVPWRIVPHWSSDHPESSDADKAVQALLEAELPFRTLRDGHAIVIDDTGEQLVGWD